MPEKSLEEILEKFAGLPKESSTWGKGYLDNYLKERNHLITQATQAIRDYFLAKLPKEKGERGLISTNFRDKDGYLAAQRRGFDDVIAEIRRAIEEG